MMLTKSITVVSTIIFLAGCEESTTLKPNNEESQYKIAFTSANQEYKNYEIYTMDTDGNNMEAITDEIQRCYFPAWSPDGSRIAFSSSWTIFLMNSDGSQLDSLARGREPAWSPDGSKIVFRSWTDSSGFFTWPIHIIDVDGTNEHRLTGNSNFNSNPSWSPDGSKIAFSSRSVWSGWLRFNICTMDTNGSNLVFLTSKGDADEPTWSPDGSKMAYTWDPDSSASYIIVMNADGRNQTLLTDGTANARSPAWSPDGNKIVYSQSHDLFVMDADGSNKINLTNSMNYDDFPVWSPVPIP